MIFHKVKPIISRRYRNIIISLDTSLVEFNPDRIQYGLTAHRLHDPACSKNRNSTDNSKTGIKCFVGQFLSIRHIDQYLKTTLII